MRIPSALVVGASETAALLHLPVLEGLRDTGRLKLVEICDLDVVRAEAMRDRFGFNRASSDARAAVARKDIDLVYLFGSARMHHELGLAALDHGKHLFVEKPVAPSYIEAIGLADAAKSRRLQAVGGHNRRFHAGLLRIRSSAGNAGWTYAEAVFHKPETQRLPPFGARSWLTGNGIHALDAMVFMMGGLPEYLASAASGINKTPGVFSALMRWPGGAQGVFLCNNEAGARREDYSFHAPGESWRLTKEGLTREQGGEAAYQDLPDTADGFFAEHEAFLAAVKTGGTPLHAIEALLPSLFLAELIETGHHGVVGAPTRKVAAGPSLRCEAILVAGARRLRPALPALPGGYATIALEEVVATDRKRPDIRAAVLAPDAAPLTDAVLDRLPNLAIVGIAGLSLVRYAPDQLLARNITIVNASHAYAESVAEFALGLAILGRRRAFTSHEAMRRGGWGTTVPAAGARGAALRLARFLRPFAMQLGLEARLLRTWRTSAPLAALAAAEHRATPRHLRGAVVGLIGWGANARAFTRLLIGVGARVIVYSNHATPNDIRVAGASPAPLAAVLAADIVSLHRGLTPATRHAIGAAELDRLRPGSVLINVARSALIEPGSLIARLSRGDVIACLDTFENEPPRRNDPLRRLSNAFLTAHIAGGSSEMHDAAMREVIAKVGAYLEGGAVEAIDAARMATMT